MGLLVCGLDKVMLNRDEESERNEEGFDGRGGVK